jgi:hypothetical protein
MGKTFNSKYSSGSGRTYSDSDPQWFFKESPTTPRLQGGDMPYYRNFGGSDDVGVYGNADIESGGSKKFPKSRINNGKCSICGKSQCMGKDERGFGMHGGTCNYCGKEECTGDNNRGFSVHLVTPTTSQPKPATQDEPTKLYSDEKDALKDMLNDHGQRYNDFPIEYSPEALEFLKKSSVIVLPSLDEEAPDRIIFNAAKFDLEPDFDDPEYKQEEHTDSFESGEPEQVDTEDNEDEDENVGTTSYEPSTLPEHPEEAIHELKNDDDDDYEEHHMPSYEEEGGEDEDEEDKPIPIQKTAPLPKKFKKPSNAVATEETTVEHDPSSESFEEDEDTTPAGFTPSVDKSVPRKTTITIPDHGIQGQSVVNAMMNKQNNEQVQKYVLRKSDQEKTDYNTTLINTVRGIAKANELKSQINKNHLQQAIENGSIFNGDNNEVTHNNCGCEERNGFETPENIAKIKTSDEYKNGIKSINAENSPYKRDLIDKFIAKSYRCKGDPK